MARRYRKVEVSMWGDDRFRRLSQSGQFLWIYLLTGPSTTIIPGVVVARESAIAEVLGWGLADFRAAFAELAAVGLVEADWSAGLVLLKKALLDSDGEPRETSRPESPNVLRSWAKSWPEIPDSPLKNVLLRRLSAFAAALGAPFAKGFAEAFAKASKEASREAKTAPFGEGFAKASAKGSSNQNLGTSTFGEGRAHPSPNQDQEQEQEQDVSQPRAISVVRIGPGKLAAELATRIWFEHCDRHDALRSEFSWEGGRLTRTEAALGWRDLRERIRAFGDDLAGAEASARHVLAVRDAEARSNRSLRWFGEGVWSEKQFSHAVAQERPRDSSSTTATEREFVPYWPGAPAEVDS